MLEGNAFMKLSHSLLIIAGIAAVSSAARAQTVLLNQDWSSASLITADDNWSGLWNATTQYGIIGYRGDDLTTSTGTDPRTLLGDGTAVVDVIANQTNPNTLASGGVAEFAGYVALQGSGTADAPSLGFSVKATGYTNITVSYNLKDVDGSTDNSAQQVALQYRLSSSGAWTNLASGYVADASSGPSLATLVTPVSVALASVGENSAYVQFRVITTNAVGNDEWVAVDDISVTGTAIPEPSSFVALLGLGGLGFAVTRRRR